MASQTLLSLIARLQKDISVTQGRTMLLDFARKSCGARLALLFELDNARQTLILLAHTGQHPHPSAFSPDTASIEIPLQGLFASTLSQQASADIPDIARDQLSLPQERACAWPHGRVLLYPLRQGVLVFCFSPAGKHTALSAQTQEELLICASLLSAYIVREETYQTVPRLPTLPTKKQRAAKRTSHPEKVSSELAHAPHASLRIEEILHLLTALCELGLAQASTPDRQKLNEQILHLLSSTLHAPASGLWRYQPDLQTFTLQTTSGECAMFAKRATDELNRVAGVSPTSTERPVYGLMTQPAPDERVLVWHTLRYHGQLLGALGLVQQPEPELLLDQRLLLDAASDVVALILLHDDQAAEQRQALIDQERARLARELHDSVVQDVAHVTQKLDYIQRILEKQPQTALHEIDQARTLLARSLRDLRDGISSLLPIPLAEQEFDEALKALLHEYNQHLPHLKITYDIDNLAFWPQALQTPIYRFMQEALNNIRKHASANEVSIRIRQVAGLGVVQVSDNGRGFELEQARRAASEHGPHIGLASMETRIRQAGGILEIQSRPGEGTTLKARFPLTSSSAILTEREREVLRLLVDGLTNRAISERLSVSLETVKSHVHHIMQKMHVQDRTQAAVVATKQQWL